MKIELTTISTKKFLLITLLSIPFIMFLCLGLAIFTTTQWLVLLIIPFLGLSIFLGQRLSKSVTRIDLNVGDYFKVDDRKISYKNVIGYFINETGLIQTSLCLRLDTNKTIQITGSSFGVQGEIFQKAQEEIIKTLKRENQHLLKLEYQDVYVRQANILRQILYVMVGIVIIMDIAAVYLFVIGKMHLPWQIFFANFLLVGLIPYMKKRKITSTNTNYKQ